MGELLVVLAFAGVLSLGTWAFLMGPIGRAIGRWIEARTPNAQGQLMADLAEMDVRLSRLERLLREATSGRGRRWPRTDSD
jgi:hypothetical protein